MLNLCVVMHSLEMSQMQVGFSVVAVGQQSVNVCDISQLSVLGHATNEYGSIN